MPEFEIWSALPVLVPAGWGLMVLAFAPWFREDPRWLWFSSVAGMLLSLLLPAWTLLKIDGFGGLRETAGLAGAANTAMLRTDALSLWLDVLFAFAGLGAVLIAPHYLEKAGAHRPEVYPLLFFSVAGMALMVGTENLVMIFLGLEVLSIPLYVLSGFVREKTFNIEAALKYFLLGAFSTGFFVYGLALILGATGSFSLRTISINLQGGELSAPYGTLMLLTGLALVIVAFAFKLGAVPFQFWVPDVYQGAPTPVTAFMAVGTKAAAFGVLLRVLHTGFSANQELVERWSAALSVLAVLTMVLGNLLALAQTRLKRLLAYSSIAHAGYLLLALLTPIDIGPAALVFYLFTYGFMTLGAFAIVALFTDGEDDLDHFDHFAGLWHRRPLVAASMGIFMLSLAGIPPTGGFVGKLAIFMAAVRSDHAILAAVMGITSVIGAAYYLRVIIAMFLRPPVGDTSANLRVPGMSRLVLGLTVAGTLVLGVLPLLLMDPLASVQQALATMR